MNKNSWYSLGCNYKSYSHFAMVILGGLLEFSSPHESGASLLKSWFLSASIIFMLYIAVGIIMVQITKRVRRQSAGPIDRITKRTDQINNKNLNDCN